MLPDDPLEEFSTVPRPEPSSLEWAGLAAIVVIAAGLRIWKLDQNGTGNPYYGACVRSMLASPGNFFFGSFDPVGIVTVDKPPVALWIQAASAKIAGYSGLSVLLPQAFMGVVSVVLTYHLVRRVYGAGAGSFAGLVLAVTPICVAIDRDNLPDTALVLVLLLATWALSRAAETGRLGLLLGAMALVGLAFNIKMLAAFVVLPTFVLAYWLAAPIGWKTRLAWLATSGVLLLVASLSWPIAVELTPKDRRPYIGGSMNNSALELALGYNGIARIMGMGGFGPPGGSPPSPGTAIPTKPVDEAIAPFPPGGRGGPGGGRPPFGPGGMPGFGGIPGFTRFGNAGIAGLITWLFPLAILGAGVASTRSRFSWPIGREHLGLVVWGGWFATHWVVFSFARGIFHEYYTTVMGPAVAALAGIGVIALWDASLQGGLRVLLLPSTILLTAAWQASIVNHYPDWRRWLLPTILGAAVLGSFGLIASRWLALRWSSIPWARISASVGMTALFVCPMLWSLAPVLTKGNSLLPTADPTMLGVKRDGPAAMPFPPGSGPFESNSKQTRKLIDFLAANRHDAKILVAGLDSMSMSPIIIETGEPAVSIGGFMGGDPALTKAQFVAMVEDGRLRFFYFGGGPGGGPGFGLPPGGPPGRPPQGMGFPAGGPPGMMGNTEITAWVREHGKAVDAKLWKAQDPAEEVEPEPSPDEPFDPARMFHRMGRMTQLYDLRPDLGLVEASDR